MQFDWNKLYATNSLQGAREGAMPVAGYNAREACTHMVLCCALHMPIKFD
jgi:hypothetical protein